MVFLEFAPRSPFHDIEGTVRRIRDRFPGISDLGVNQAVARMLDSGTDRGYKPRTKGRYVYLFGADIMSAQIDQIPAWPLMSDGVRERLLDHPVEGGITLEDRLEANDDPQQTELIQAGLANHQHRAGVNRSVLISPRGLSQTYVWCHENQWIQEVTDADADLILSARGASQKFRDIAIHGPYEDVRSYEGPNIVRERIEAPARDAEYVMRQLKAAQTWQGADLSKQ
jgi:hypothetical protein